MVAVNKTRYNQSQEGRCLLSSLPMFCWVVIWILVVRGWGGERLDMCVRSGTFLMELEAYLIDTRQYFTILNKFIQDCILLYAIKGRKRLMAEIIFEQEVGCTWVHNYRPLAYLNCILWTYRCLQGLYKVQHLSTISIIIIIYSI